MSRLAWTCPDVDELRRRVEAGEYLTHIAAGYGIAYKTLLRALKRHGIPKPKKPPPKVRHTGRGPIYTSQGKTWWKMNTPEKLARIITPQLLEKFWARVERGGNDECWIWTGSISQARGYGRFSFGGCPIPAHRASWMIHRGVIPADLFVCHHCDNVRCVNPAHLFLGTNHDNYADRDAKDRVAHGENAGNVKLREADVIAIYYSDEPNDVLAERYDVHPTHIIGIRAGKKWRRLIESLRESP